MNNFWKRVANQFINAFLFVCFVLLISAPIVYAAISWPAAPSGETAGGKYVSRLVPTGFVGAFNLVTCPTGWSEYTPAYGRVIRWIDKSGTNIDPDGLRAAGNLQTDAFQGHLHNPNPNTADAAGGYSLQRARWWNVVVQAEYYNTSVSELSGYGAPRYSTETRQKNVALLYCVKN